MGKASKTEPLISVIIPVYNVEPYLAQCLNSVISQTYKRIDIVIVDNGSTDGSNKIINKYAEKDKRINIIREKNKGISYARNAGLKNAKGSLITYIDPDDSVVNDYIEILYNAITDNNSDIAIAGHITRYPKRDYIHVCDKDMTISGKEACDRLLYDNGIDTSLWAKIFKTSEAIKHPFPNGQFFEDTAITGKLLADAKKISIIAKPIYYYNKREKSITTSSFSMEKLDLIKSTKEVVKYISKKYPDMQKGCNRRLLYSYLSTAAQLTKDKKPNNRIKQTLVSYIRKNAIILLKDKRIPFKDKLGTISLFFGFNLFKTVWFIYGKVNRLV